MAEPLADALDRIRQHLRDSETLIRAVAAGRQRAAAPLWRRVELRYVDLKTGRHLQVTRYDATQAHTSNHLLGEPAAAEIETLLSEPFGNWSVETSGETLQLRVTKKREALLHTRRRTVPVEAARGHDRAKARLLAEDDPVFVELGLSDAHGRIKPSRRDKYRQVEEFLRLLEATLTEALEKGHLRTPTAADPLRVVDLGCGNAYLTFAAQRYLTDVRGLPVRVTGVDVKAQSAEHNTRVAARLGIDADFLVGTISGALPAVDPEVVLALHACDTATDEALARAVEWRAPVVLAAPCCHHDVATQLRRGPAPAAYGLLIRHGILRERFADTLTDALRAALMRGQGYRVEVSEFVGSQHTPRNTLLRAVRTGVPGDLSEYDELIDQWRLQPRLAALLAPAG